MGILRRFALDLIGFVGLSMLFYGLFLYSKPLAWASTGAILIIFAVGGAAIRARGSGNNVS